MSAGGAMIMSVFAAIWWCVGLHGAGYGNPLVYAVALVITLTILILARRSRDTDAPPPPERARHDRLVGIVSGVEGLAILIAVNVLGNTGLADFAAPCIALIVGLHFLPLARWLPAPRYYITAALLIVVSLVGMLLPDAATRRAVVSVGAAVLLWGTSVAVLRSSSRAAEAGH